MLLTPCGERVAAPGRRETDMGLFSKKPDKNVPVLTAEEVKRRLMALNRDTAPYRIIDGASEGVDLIAEWKIVDAQWYELFAKASIKKGQFCRLINQALNLNSS